MMVGVRMGTVEGGVEGNLVFAVLLMLVTRDASAREGSKYIGGTLLARG